MSVPPLPGAVWSAPPTPLTDDRRLDLPCVERAVTQHLRLGIAGVMLAGTCGEGAWLRTEDREALVRATVAAAAGRLRISVQVTDNSALRVLANLDQAAAAGAELGIVDAPWYFFNATPQRKFEHYREIIRHSPLPIGLYDRGAHAAHAVPEDRLAELLAEPKLVMVKDSSQSLSRRAVYLEASRRRPELVVLNGDEFKCVEYLTAGYTGLLLGGGIFNGAIARRLYEAVRSGRLDDAQRVQARMNDLMWRVYGGHQFECWLTGLKELLVQMKVFRTHQSLLGYPLTATCREQIRAAVDGSDGLGYREDLFGLSPR